MIQILQGDCLDILHTLPDKSVHCGVTSPPYWGLRDYGVAGQLGLEPTPEEYVCKMVIVFRELRRVLRDDGTLWLNMGDSYAAGTRDFNSFRRDKAHVHVPRMTIPRGLKPKDLIGIPWRVAFALQADGWYLRSDIIWSKPNPMPESVTDRPTKAHEYIFLLSKSERYYYDAHAIREPCLNNGENRGVGFGYGMDADVRNRQRVKWKTPDGWDTSKGNGSHGSFHRDGREDGRTGYVFKTSGNKERKLGSARGRPDSHLGGSVPWEGTNRNKRTVWTAATKPYPEAHFATYPPALITPCILAGCPEGGTVIDMFAGSGTTLEVAARLGRNAIGIELSCSYIELIKKRVAPWMNQKSLFEVTSS